VGIITVWVSFSGCHTGGNKKAAKVAGGYRGTCWSTCQIARVPPSAKMVGKLNQKYWAPDTRIIVIRMGRPDINVKRRALCGSSV